jgi:tripartite-type tricarboxylate transporter receptor subunit TctC
MSFKHALAACVLLAAGTPALAQTGELEAFYKGKTINMFIGYPAGGTYDLYARTIARHLGKHVPGRPLVVPMNMPGAGTLTATSHVYSVAPQNGTAIVATASSMPFQPMFQKIDVPFDAAKANWLPTPAGYTAIMLVFHKSPVQTFEDLKRRETIMGTISPGSTPHFIAVVLNSVLGTKIKPIPGYPNMNSNFLAMERGEFDGYPTVPPSAIERTYRAQYEKGEYRPILQIGPKRNANFPKLENVPLARDLAQNDADRQILDFAAAPQTLGYPYMMGPGVPAERVKGMRKAFMDVFADAEFLAEAKKATLDIEPLDGEQVQKIIADAYAIPQDVKERLKVIFDSQFK